MWNVIVCAIPTCSSLQVHFVRVYTHEILWTILWGRIKNWDLKTLLERVVQIEISNRLSFSFFSFLISL